MGKEQIIRELRDARGKILELARELPAVRRDEIFLGTWSVGDLLAHLAGWDYSNIQSVQEIRTGKNPGVFQQWNPDWAAYNAQLVKQYKRADWKKMLQALKSSHRELIELLETVPAEDFEHDFGVRSPRGRTITIARHLQAEIEDEQKHRQQILDWLAR